MLMEVSLHGVTFKFQSLISLKFHWFFTLTEYIVKCIFHILSSFTFNWLRPCTSTEHVNHSQNILISIITFSILLHVNEISLPLVVHTTRYILPCPISFPGWLVERVCRLTSDVGSLSLVGLGRWHGQVL